MTTNSTSARPDLQEIPARSRADAALSVENPRGTGFLDAAPHCTWLSFQTAVLWRSALVIFLFSADSQTRLTSSRRRSKLGKSTSWR